MDNAARVFAIITCTVAVACGLVNLSWWIDTRFAAYSGYAVMFTAFMTGLLAWFVMFGMLVSRGVGYRRWPTAGQAASVALVWRNRARLLLLGGLGLILATAIAGALHANAQVGIWGIDAPYGWHHCHWPLTANHETQHLCVSHERYLLVDHATDRIFVAFGIGMLTIECILFTTLAATARPLRKREVGVARA